MRTLIVKEPILDLKCGLAEGPFWERDENVLRFVDISNNILYWMSLDDKPRILRSEVYHTAVSVTANIAGSTGNFIVGSKYGIGIATNHDNGMHLIRSFWSQEETTEGKNDKMRANDGAVDCEGRFWVSALRDPKFGPFHPDGVLFRLDHDGNLRRVITGITIPNGISWSMDDTTMYFTDSADKSIYAYDFEKKSGTISNKRVFFQAQEADAAPDGHAQDVDGHLWVAIWGSWKVVRVSPDGHVSAEILLPTRCITAVAFVNDELYITSEAEPEPEKYPESAKYDGGIFKCHVGIQGRAITEVKFNQAAWMQYIK